MIKHLEYKDKIAINAISFETSSEKGLLSLLLLMNKTNKIKRGIFMGRKALATQVAAPKTYLPTHLPTYPYLPTYHKFHQDLTPCLWFIGKNIGATNRLNNQTTNRQTFAFLGLSLLWLKGD